MLEVLDVGPQALVQDRGRPGWAGLGVPVSGAADRAAHDLANRLVANPPGAATVEVLLGGFAARALRPLTVALAGAAAPAEVDGKPVSHHSVVRLAAGQRLRLGLPAAGLRTYLAVRGGFEPPAVLGSRSTDTLSGLGPDPLGRGAVLPVGPRPDAHPSVDFAPVNPPTAEPLTLRVHPGPDIAHLRDPLGLARTRWTVAPDSDRVALRLAGPPPATVGEANGVAQGLVRGAVQLPPCGEPVLFLADHPVTGGYPVVAVVAARDVDRASQARPGQAVTFALARRL